MAVIAYVILYSHVYAKYCAPPKHVACAIGDICMWLAA